MKKLMSLLLSALFVGSLLVIVSGCTPKQEQPAQAPAMEQQAVPTAMENTPAANAATPGIAMTPAAEVTPAPAE